MQPADLPLPDADALSGRKLYGNDFGPDQLRAWYQAEEYGYYDLYGASGAETGENFSVRAMTRADGAMLRGRRYEVCLALGCAGGEDIAALGLDIGRLIAIEPAEQFWCDQVEGIPAEFRKPTLDGTLDLPEASVDLVVAISVLHHIANVEYVLAELGRVLRPGGVLLTREPISSMGDFRAPRQGATRCERGIPVALMRTFLARAGLTLDRLVYRNTPGLPELAGRFGITAFNSPALVALDRAASALTRFNDRYWRPALIDKLAPRIATYFALKKA